MRIGIIEISGWHYEYFDTFCKVFSNEIQEIYTLRKYEQQIDKEKIKRTTFLKKRGNYISIISLYKCIKKINESNSDFYFILTSDCNYIFLFFLVLLTNKKIIITLHNINSWMKKPKDLKNKIKYFFKMKILEKVYGINVIADNLREYLIKEYNYSKMITVIPYTFFKEIKNSKPNESEKIISIPGSADLNRRNYDQIIELANIREDIKIYLLGRKTLEFNRKYKVLPKNVISFENYISQEEYEKIILKSMFLLGPTIKKQLREREYEEEYGYSKESGFMFSQITYSKVGVVPKYIEVDSRLKSSTFQYESLTELLQVIEKIEKNTKDFNKKAKENSLFFTKEKIRSELLKQLKEEECSKL